MASLIIWDEATMTKRQGVEALDNNMRDVLEHPDLPFVEKLLYLEEILGKSFLLFERGQGHKLSMHRYADRTCGSVCAT